MNTCVCQQKISVFDIDIGIGIGNMVIRDCSFTEFKNISHHEFLTRGTKLDLKSNNCAFFSKLSVCFDINQRKILKAHKKTLYF